jgi:hypothetical protein
MQATIGYIAGLMSLPETFCWNMIQMTDYNARVMPECDIKYYKSPYSDIETARNDIVRHTEGEVTLMIDTDQSFPPDTFVRMLRLMWKADLSVLAALTVSRREPHLPAIFHWEGDFLRRIGQWDKEKEIIQIGSGGAGCLMVRNTVFTSIQMYLRVGPFTKLDNNNEDHSFSLRCRKLNIPIHFSPWIKVDHMALKACGEQEYLPPAGDLLKKWNDDTMIFPGEVRR